MSGSQRRRVIAFDKTGTLTCGTPNVVDVGSVCEKFDRDEIYTLAACAEQMSEHPLGRAIVSCYKKTGKSLFAAENFHMIPGRGVCADARSHTLP